MYLLKIIDGNIAVAKYEIPRECLEDEISVDEDTFLSCELPCVVTLLDGVATIGAQVPFEDLPPLGKPSPPEPPKPPTDIEVLQQENTLLKAQVGALSSQNDFHEELIVELANQVYA